MNRRAFLKQIGVAALLLAVRPTQGLALLSETGGRVGQQPSDVETIKVPIEGCQTNWPWPDTNWYDNGNCLRCPPDFHFTPGTVPLTTTFSLYRDESGVLHVCTLNQEDLKAIVGASTEPTS